MKKVVCFITTIILTMSLITSGIALDFTGYSDEELIAMYKEISKELADRKSEMTVQMLAGDYVGGDSISEGDYFIFVDNRYGKKTVTFNYQPTDSSYEPMNATIPVGNSFEAVITVFKDDHLSVTGSFNLTTIID